MNARIIVHCVFGLMLSMNTAANAAPIPVPDDLRAQMGTEPMAVAVYEPHLATAQENVRIDYVGYPAEDVLALVLGANWRARSDAIEFRALDGYASRIDVAKFAPGRAFMVLAREDGAPFTIDNIAQNQTNVALGPYYLVWDTISYPALQADGAGIWPYQVNEILPFAQSDAALLPDGLDPRYREGAMLAQTHCLNCHTVNGYGGDKFVGDIARITRGLSQEYFTDWVLDPASLRNGTTMPGLPLQLHAAERLRIAAALYGYLTHVPQAQ